MNFSRLNIIRTIVYSTGGILGVGSGLSTALVTTNPLLGLGVGAGVGVLTALGGTFGPIKATKEATSESKLDTEVTPKLPDELRDEFEKLDKLYILHKDSQSPLSDEMESIIVNAQELFSRINARMDTQAGRLAAVNYTDTLKKLNKALGKDYYLDIVKNPRLWDNPERRILAVEAAVTATDTQILKQIRQVNASQDIEYSVSTDSLIGADDSTAEEMISDK